MLQSKKRKREEESKPLITELNEDIFSIIISFIQYPSELIMLSLTCKTIYSVFEKYFRRLVPKVLTNSGKSKVLVKQDQTWSISYAFKVNRLLVIKHDPDTFVEMIKKKPDAVSHYDFQIRGFYGNCEGSKITKFLSTSVEIKESAWSNMRKKQIGSWVKGLILTWTTFEHRELFKILSLCPNLEELHASCILSSLNVSNIPKFNHLKRLKLKCCRKIPSHTPEHYQSSLSEKSWVDILLQHTPNIEAFHLESDTILLPQSLLHCSKLKEMGLTDTSETNKVLDCWIVEILYKLPKLEKLLLKNVVSGIILEMIPNITNNLKVLHIIKVGEVSNMRISLKGKKMENLKELKIFGFGNINWESVGEIAPNIKKLSTFNCTPEKCKYFSTSSEEEIRNFMISMIKKLSKLEFLDIDPWFIDKKMLMVLSEKPIKELYISPNLYFYILDSLASPECLMDIKPWEKLERLVLPQNPIDNFSEWITIMTKKFPYLRMFHLIRILSVEKPNFGSDIAKVLECKTVWKNLECINGLTTSQWKKLLQSERKIVNLSGHYLREYNKMELEENKDSFEFEWLYLHKWYFEHELHKYKDIKPKGMLDVSVIDVPTDIETIIIENDISKILPTYGDNLEPNRNRLFDTVHYTNRDSFNFTDGHLISWLSPSQFGYFRSVDANQGWDDIANINIIPDEQLDPHCTSDDVSDSGLQSD